ncbi:MAG: GDP-L-colitose synthase [Chlamydiae bacterium]|nr:GDP-L-colitose synthase [Chlamydiota bacterium]
MKPKIVNWYPPDNMKKKIFFAGASGTIGRNFFHRQKDKYTLLGPRRRELELTKKSDVDCYFKNKKFDILINGASIGGSRKDLGNEQYYFDCNLRVFENLFSHVSGQTKFIQLGSGAEYARPFQQKNITEDQLGKRVPSDIYGLSKLKISQNIKSSSFKKAVSLHIFGLYAPYEDYQMRFISNAIVRALSKLPIIINNDIKFDYVFIDDFIRILDTFIHHDAEYSNYNIGTGRSLFLTEIAEEIKKILGNQVEIIVKSKTLNYEYTCSNERLSSFLGSQFQFTPLRTGLQKMIHYYSTNINNLNIDWIKTPV